MGLVGFALGRLLAKKPPHVELDEMHSAGLDGLWRAARLWDPSIAKFSTYAVTAIHRGILRTFKQSRRAPMQHLRDDAELVIAGRAPTENDIEIEALMQMVEALPERLRQVISMRYIEGRTLQDIGAAFNVTRERVRQIEAKALEVLREMNGVSLATVALNRWNGRRFNAKTRPRIVVRPTMSIA